MYILCSLGHLARLSNLAVVGEQHEIARDDDDVDDNDDDDVGGGSST